MEVRISQVNIKLIKHKSMEREIKFRGRSIENRKWEYGDLLQFDDGSVCIGVHSKNYTDDGFNLGQYDRIALVDESTIGEYTGLKDKNGKKAWEGDIVEWQNLMGTNMRSVINYVDRGFAFTDASGKPDEIWCYEFEKIGNIHDTPELLTDKE